MTHNRLKPAKTGDIPDGEKKLVQMGEVWILLVNLERRWQAVEGASTRGFFNYAYCPAQ